MIKATLHKLSFWREELAMGSALSTLRIITGVILFLFVITHFLNHALGIHSIAWMETGQDVRLLIWRSSAGTILLYFSLMVHFALGVWSFIARRTWRMPLWQAMQYLVSLLIPVFLAQHIIATRALYELAGLDDDYQHELAVLYTGAATQQNILLIAVWVHSVVGIHYWLRIHAFYQRFLGLWFSLAAAIPLLAMWGWYGAARRQWLLELDQTGFTQEMVDIYNEKVSQFNNFMIMLCVVVIGIWVIRWFYSRITAKVEITYPGGQKISVAPGMTLLEISQRNDIPHAAVCGGRARCSTCRTEIIAGADDLDPPGDMERMVLDRQKAGRNIRLACQIRPRDALQVRPVIPVQVDEASTTTVRDSYHWGVEQRVALLFCDIRGFTALSENRLPYDTVFLLNRYLQIMSKEIEAAGGYVDKYIGDGIMAIFGISSNVQKGCTEAIDAVERMTRALNTLNEEIAENVPGGIRIGIGVHAGHAILGRIGATGRGASGLTALGDTVNTASRLESATKDLGAIVVISSQTLQAAGYVLGEDDLVEVTVRGREKPIRAVSLKDLSEIEALRAGSRSEKAEAF